MAQVLYEAGSSIFHEYCRFCAVCFSQMHANWGGRTVRAMHNSQLFVLVRTERSSEQTHKIDSKVKYTGTRIFNHLVLRIHMLGFLQIIEQAAPKVEDAYLKAVDRVRRKLPSKLITATA